MTFTITHIFPLVWKVEVHGNGQGAVQTVHLHQKDS